MPDSGDPYGRYAIYWSGTILIDPDVADLTPHERGYDDGWYGRDMDINGKWGDVKRQEYVDGYSEGQDRREMESYMHQGEDDD